MRPAEICVTEGALGVGVAERTSYVQIEGESCPAGVCEQVCEVEAHGSDLGGGHGHGIRPSVRRAADELSTHWHDASSSTSNDAIPGFRPYLLAKACTEWCLAFALLVLTAPLVALFALLVKVTSPGPAFYFQTRLGRNGTPYRICKLRTMMHDCEAATGPVWAAKDDVRITAIGKILGDTHMDELPQLWNVLCGQMALIGPRPERPEIISRIERQVPDYRRRLEVRPGVTGLAQMRLPADSDLESVKLKLAHDLYYIRNVSIIMDLRIAACTAFYFTAAAATALCNTAVGSYGRAVRAPSNVRERAVEAA